MINLIETDWTRDSVGGGETIPYPFLLNPENYPWILTSSDTFRVHFNLKVVHS